MAEANNRLVVVVMDMEEVAVAVDMMAHEEAAWVLAADDEVELAVELATAGDWARLEHLPLRIRYEVGAPRAED